MHDVIVIGGGQSGLAAARAAQNQGLTPMILEAGPEPVGSWPHYYDSLTLFSPAEYSGISGAPFPGEADRYPERDEVAEYLRLYPAALGVDIRTETRVRSVKPPEWLAKIVTATLVLDTGEYRNALDTGRMNRRPMFEGFECRHSPPT